MVRQNRAFVILITLAAIVAVAFAAFYGWKAYRDNHPQSYIDFQQYAPTKIVNGLRITDKTLEVWESHPLLWFRPFNVSISLRLNQSNTYSFIDQSKEVTAIRDYSCDAENVDCFDKVTKNGRGYKLIHHFNPRDLKATPLIYDEVSTEDVHFVINGTRIHINLNPVKNTPTTDEAWSDMIDSFEPTTFTDLRVKHMRPGP